MLQPRKLASYDNKESVMGNLIAELLHGATKTHFIHLKTNNYAAHMALGEFYETLVGLVDSVAEQYQGVTEQLLEYPSVTVTPLKTIDDAVSYLRELHIKITEAQRTCEYSEIINELDVIKSQINSTKYKLLFLH